MIKCAKWAAIAAGLIFVFLAGVYGAAQTSAGKGVLADAIAGMLSERGRIVTVSGLDGRIPDRIRIARVTIADESGTWVTVEGLVLDWRPLALFGGALDITDLAARRVSMARCPPCMEDEPGAGSLQLPSSVRLERLELTRVVLEEPVIGAPAELQVSGRFSVEDGETVRTTLRAERSDNEHGWLRVSSIFDRSAQTLDLTAELSEAPGGLAARILGIPGLRPLHARLDGRGPIAEWRGTLDAALGTETQLTAELRLAGGRAPSFDIHGTARAAELVPPDWRALLEPTFTVSLAGRWDRDAGVLHVRELAAQNPGWRIDASGDLSVETLHVTASARLRIDATDTLAPLIAPTRIGSGTATIHVAGPLFAPTAALAVSLDRVALDGAFATASDVFEATVAVSPGDGAEWEISGIAEMAGFVTSLPLLDAVLGATPKLAFEGSATPGTKRINLASVRLDGATARANVNGWLESDLAAGALEFEVGLSDVSPLAKRMGHELSGTADLSGQFRVEDRAVRGTARLAMDGLSSHSELLDRLLGPRSTVTARISHASRSVLTLRDIEWVTADGSRRVSGHFTTDFDTIEAEYAVAVSDLAPFMGAAGVRAAGGAELMGRLAGPLTNPSTTARLSAERIDLEEIVLHAVAIDARVDDFLTQPRGTLAAEAIAPFGTVRAKGDFVADGQKLSLADIRLDMPGAGATGTLSVPYDGRPLTGVLRAEASDLAMLTAALGPWPVAGQAALSVRLTDRAGRQQAHIQASSRNLTSADDDDGVPLRIAELSGEATAVDPFTAPSISGQLNLVQGVRGAAEIAAARLSISGTPRAFTFSGTVQGNLGGATDIALEGHFRHAPEATEVSLAALSGRLAGHEIALLSPLSVQRSRSQLEVTDVVASYAGANVEISGALGPTNVSVDIDVQSFPVDLAARLWPDIAATGSVDLALRLSGHPSRPSGTAQLSSSRLAVSSDPMMPSLSLSLSGRAALEQNRLTFDFAAHGDDESEASATLNGSMPLRISLLEEISAAVPDNEPIEMVVSMRGRLGFIERVVSLDSHRLTGNVGVATTVTGTMRKPRLKGNATVQDGRYENLVSGTVLEDIGLAAEFSDASRIVLRGSANDGEAGRITLEGDVELDSTNSVSLRVGFREATLVRRDELLATASGDITVSGWPGRLEVRGEAETDTVEMRLINTLPPDVITLDVTEIGRMTDVSAREAEETKAPDAQRAIGELDLVVRFPRRLFVRGRGLDSEWAGELRIVGPIDRPHISGTLRAVRGAYSLAGKTFNLRGGTLEVAQRDGNMVATLDLETAYVKDGFTAIAHITGPASNPQVTLSSTPELPRDEILSRILFGRATGRLTALEALQLADAAATLSGRQSGAAGGIMNIARDVLGVDVLRVEAGDDAGPAIRAGKYIGDGIYVGAKQEAGTAGTSATVEIEVTPNIVLESEAGQSGRSGVGVRWKYDY